MKKQISIILSAIIFAACLSSVKAQNTFPASGAAGIGTTTPNSSCVLDLSSINKGFLTPRMTKSQRDAIVSPATGLMIYQTNSTPGFYYFDGAWKPMMSKSANTSLSNLAGPTAINADLLPGINNVMNLGSSSQMWRNIYLNNIQFANSTTQTTAFIPYGAGTGIDITGTTISIPNGAIDDHKLNAMGATIGQVMTFDGFKWGPASISGGGGPETDPEVGTIDVNRVPHWNGTELTTSELYYSETGGLGVGSNPVDLYRLDSRCRPAQFGNGFRYDVAVNGENDIPSFGTYQSVSTGMLGVHDPSFLFGGNWVNSNIKEVGVIAKKSLYGYQGAALVAWNEDNEGLNYGLYSEVNGTGGGYNIAVYARSKGGSLNYAIIVPDDGGNVGIGYAEPSARLDINDNGSADPFRVRVHGSARLTVNSNGGTSIGTATVAPADGMIVKGSVIIGDLTAATGYKVSVDGKIICEEIKVQNSTNWPDYVFAKEYSLKPLSDLEAEIKTAGHLPGIPSACEVEEQGVEVGNMQQKLLEKVEELTLYVIEQQKEIEGLKSELNNH